MQTARGALCSASRFGSVSRLQLLADRKRADALSRRCEDRVDQRRRERGNAGLADTTRRRVGSGRHDVDVGYEWRVVHPDDLEVVKILLLHLAVLEGDLA